MPTIASFSMKLVRADEHLQALNNEVAAFLQVGPYEVVTEQDIPAGFLRARVVYRQEPPDLLFMLIGDVLHNLRSALDHLAWSLAGTKADKKTEFPVFLKKNEFLSRGRDKIHDMPTRTGDYQIVAAVSPATRVS